MNTTNHSFCRYPAYLSTCTVLDPQKNNRSGLKVVSFLQNSINFKLLTWDVDGIRAVQEDVPSARRRRPILQSQEGFRITNSGRAFVLRMRRRDGRQYGCNLWRLGGRMARHYGRSAQNIELVEVVIARGKRTVGGSAEVLAQ